MKIDVYEQIPVMESGKFLLRKIKGDRIDHTVDKAVLSSSLDSSDVLRG